MYTELYQHLMQHQLQPWQRALEPLLTDAMQADTHGDLPRWFETLQELPDVQPANQQFNRDTITLGTRADLTPTQWSTLKTQLMTFHPWRKGPFDLFGHVIDTEWRSDWKWARVAPHLDFHGKRVLDVGSGNGYYCFRMIGEGAAFALGIDPTYVFNLQYLALKKYAGNVPAYVIPLGIEQLPAELNAFDLVFSMGVFYHRRSPIEHLFELKQRLTPGGQLILETLIIDGGKQTVLVPAGRYAKMRNVWFLPSIDTLIGWMKRCQYRNIQLLDVTETTSDEQRTTAWMHFHSLKDFLDPQDPKKTVEGYPAPKRAILMAEHPA